MFMKVKPLVFFFFFLCGILAGAGQTLPLENSTYIHGALVRGDSTQKKVSIIFTGDEFGDGGGFI